MLRATMAQTVDLRGVSPPPSSAAAAVAAGAGSPDVIDLTSSPSASEHDPRERPRRGRRAVAEGMCLNPADRLPCIAVCLPSQACGNMCVGALPQHDQRSHATTHQRTRPAKHLAGWVPRLQGRRRLHAPAKRPREPHPHGNARVALHLGACCLPSLSYPTPVDLQI